MSSIGLIFVLYNLCGFLFSPVVGHYLKVITRRWCIIIGMVVMLGSLCLFGCARYFDLWTFICLSALARAIMGLGEAMIVTASYAILASDYQQNLLHTVGFMEMGGAIGAGIAPIIATGLYTVVGYAMTMVIFALIYSPCLITSYIFIHVQQHYVEIA